MNNGREILVILPLIGEWRGSFPAQFFSEMNLGNFPTSAGARVFAAPLAHLPLPWS